MDNKMVDVSVLLALNGCSVVIILPVAVINHLLARGPDNVPAIPICSLCALKMEKNELFLIQTLI